MLSKLNVTVLLQSAYVPRREKKKKKRSGCLISGSKQTLGFHELFNQGRSQQSFWKKQPKHWLAIHSCTAPFLLVVQGFVWLCEEWPCFNPVLPSVSRMEAQPLVSARQKGQHGSGNGASLHGAVNIASLKSWSQVLEEWKLLLGFLCSQHENILGGWIPLWKAPLSHACYLPHYFLVSIVSQKLTNQQVSTTEAESCFTSDSQ